VEAKGYVVWRKPRGQFPNNPRCWSYLQAQGSTNVDMQKPKGGGNHPSLLSWGRGVYGWKYINKPDKGVKERRWKQ